MVEVQENIAKLTDSRPRRDRRLSEGDPAGGQREVES